MCERISAAGPSFLTPETNDQKLVRKKAALELCKKFQLKLDALRIEGKTREQQIRQRSADEFERFKAELIAKNNDVYERKAREIKSKDWCRNCLQEAHIQCCLGVTYCSLWCQRQNWDEHRQYCIRIVTYQFRASSIANGRQVSVNGCPTPVVHPADATEVLAVSFMTLIESDRDGYRKRIRK